jgi:hypothetical protein
VVLDFLHRKAIADIDATVSPSPAVDTLVAFLLHLHRVEEAAEVHEAHAKVVQHRTFATSEEARKSVQERKLLLDAHRSLPDIPEINHRLLKHLQELL